MGQPDASPKAISGRTSYLPVRLAFHPYPQLIPSFCNRNGFGPPPAVRRVSPWPWVAHQVSCLISAIAAHFKLAFAPAPAVPALASRRLSTRRLILQKAHGHPLKRLPLSVSERFQVLFHSPHRGSFHLSLTVLFRYRSPRVFSLGGWTPQFHAGLACPALLRIPAPVWRLRLQDFHPVSSAFPEPFGSRPFILAGPTTPSPVGGGLG